MRFYSLVITLIFSVTHAQEYTPAHDPKFYKILHLENNNEKFEKDFLEKDFFFSENPTDVTREYSSAIEAYQSKTWRHPRLNLPAACVFPARKKRIEELSGLKFPQVACPDLEFWRSKLKSTHVSLMFAGAYAQNPASVFGHSLIRLSNRSNPNRSSPLLSYVVGFLANTGDDGSLLRIRKGLLGEYPGQYLLDPFYIKLGIYNNAESRDIWESDLNFNQEEIDFLIDHLWEISNFSKSYYFIGRNCSYQILKLFEAVRPDLNLIGRKLIETLPHDSIRWVEEIGLTNSQPRFYPSLRRKISERFSKLNITKRKKIILATQNKVVLESINSPEELDLINDFWLLKNYQNKTQLSAQDSELMELSLNKRASINITSPNSQEMIHRDTGPLPAYQGHKTRSLRVGINSQDYFEFQAFFGAHGFDQDDQGFDSFSSIQYVGIQSYQPLYSKESENSLIITKIRSFENYSNLDPKKSWFVNFEFKDSSPIMKEHYSRLTADGGWGFSHEFNQIRPYFLGVLTSETDLNGVKGSILRPGLLVGFKWTFNSYRIVSEVMAFEYLNTWQTFENLNLGYSLNRNQSLYISSQNRNYLRQNRISLNYEITF